jgi:hypothetical protein
VDKRFEIDIYLLSVWHAKTQIYRLEYGDGKIKQITEGQTRFRIGSSGSQHAYAVRIR